METASPAAVGQKSAWPTRKWWAATITGLGAIATLLVQAGGFTPAVWIALIGAVVQAVVTYLLPNADTPGGCRCGPSRLGRWVHSVRGIGNERPTATST